MFNGAFTANARANNERNEFNTLTATLQTGVNRIYKNSNYKAGVVLQQFNLHGDRYRTLTGLNLEWHNTLRQQSRLNISLQYATLNYANSAQA